MELRQGKIVKKVWGNEAWIVNRPDYCGKMLFVKKGYRCSKHYHVKKAETFFILKGKVLFEYGNSDKQILQPGDIIDIPRQKLHRFTGLEDSQIVEFSTHHEDDDSYRLELSGAWGQKDMTEGSQ